MALHVALDTATQQEEELKIASPFSSMTTTEQTTTEQESHEFWKKQRLISGSSFDTESMFSQVIGPSQYPFKKIEFKELFWNRPWLPSDALRLLDKLKGGSIAERELIRLMEKVAKRASVHFQLSKGKFAAMTFHGRIVELSDTKAGLLKKIQGQKHREQIFVWKIGFNTFSGRS